MTFQFKVDDIIPRNLLISHVHIFNYHLPNNSTPPLGARNPKRLYSLHQNLTSLGDPEEMMQDVALEAAFRRLSHLRTNVTYIPESINWHTMLCKGERTLAMLCYDYCC